MKKLCALLVVLITINIVHGATLDVNGGKEKIYHGVFLELPNTDIHPDRWLKETLVRQRDGLVLNRVACGYPFNTNLWIGKLPQPTWQGYEQTAYFIDGVYRAGLLLNDP